MALKKKSGEWFKKKMALMEKIERIVFMKKKKAKLRGGRGRREKKKREKPHFLTAKPTFGSVGHAESRIP